MKLLKCLSVVLVMLVTNDVSAQDWANLGHYRPQNEEIGLPAKGETRVVFMGNSITEGWKTIHPDYFRGSYVCRGISGQTTPQMLLRFRQDVIALSPKAVVIFAGINDIAENTGPTTLEMIQDNLASMCELAKAHGIKVFICSVLPANNLPWRPDIKPADKVLTLNNWIREYAVKNKCVFVDYYSSMVNDEKGLIAEYTTDGVHCTDKGYQVMESILNPLLNKYVK